MAPMAAAAPSFLFSLLLLAVSGSPIPTPSGPAGPPPTPGSPLPPAPPCNPAPGPQPACPPGLSVYPVGPIAPFGPLAPPVIPPGPSESFFHAPPPTGDILAPLGAVPQIPSALEESLAELVPVAPPAGGAFAHVSSFVSPVQVSVTHGAPRLPGSSMEVIEPLMTIETAQCGCTIIRLYWLHEVITLCPLGTGRWAKSTRIGSAELLHEWVLTNTHDVLPNPHFHTHGPVPVPPPAPGPYPYPCC